MTAESLLPWWVVWGPWSWGPVFALLGGAAVSLMLGRTTLPPPEPWTERARAVHPARLLAAMARVMVFVAVMFQISLNAPGTEHLIRDTVTVLIALAGTLLPALRFERRLAGHTALWPGVRSLLARWVLLSALVPLLVGPVVAAGVGPQWKLPVAVGFGASLLLWSFGLNLWLARVLGLARNAGPKVRAAVERASARLNVRCRQVLELDWLAGNALAFPLTRSVVFTKPMGALLSDDELEAVAAHELGHLSEPWVVKLSRPAAIYGLYAVLAGFVCRGQYDLVSAGVGLGGLLIIFVGVARLRRAGERHADAAAHDDGKVYGRALERLYEFNLVPAVLRRPGAHGHLYDRLVASGYTPSWPRPAPPPRPALGWRLVFASLLFAPIVLSVGWAAAPATSDDARLSLAFGPQSAWAYDRLANEELANDRPRRALAYYQAAVRLKPGSGYLRAFSAMALARSGQCADAEAQYQAAQRLASDEPSPQLRTLMDSASQAVAQCQPEQGTLSP